MIFMHGGRTMVRPYKVAEMPARKIVTRSVRSYILYIKTFNTLHYENFNNANRKSPFRGYG
jgi:hypothetical protein